MIFEPAGMTSTDLRPEAVGSPNRATGYTRQNGEWVSTARLFDELVSTAQRSDVPRGAKELELGRRGTAAGGAYSTAGDLLRFAEALESGTLISRTMFTEATSPQGAPSYGHGFAIFGDGLMRNYGHNGGTQGVNTDFRVYPELGYVVVALTNLDPPSASSVVTFFENRLPVAP